MFGANHHPHTLILYKKRINNKDYGTIKGICELTNGNQIEKATRYIKNRFYLIKGEGLLGSYLGQ